MSLESSLKKVDVVNMALDLLGREPVDSMSAVRTNVHKQLERWYRTSALFVLAEHDWNDAISSTTFTTEASITNIWDDTWEYVYELPSDCLRVLDLDLDPDNAYHVENGYLYTNLYDATEGVACRYLADIREESGTFLVYPDYLADVIAHRMAYAMGPIEEKPGRLAGYREALDRAIWQEERAVQEPGARTADYWTDIS